MPAPDSSRPGPRPGDTWIAVGDDREVLMTSREWAADVLARIAEAAAAGAWPDDVTVADLARALRRAMSNVDRLPSEPSSTRLEPRERDPEVERHLDELRTAFAALDHNPALAAELDASFSQAEQDLFADGLATADTTLVEFMRGWLDAHTCGWCPWSLAGSPESRIPVDFRCTEGNATCAEIRAGFTRPSAR